MAVKPMTYEQHMALAMWSQAQSYWHIANAAKSRGDDDGAAHYLNLADTYDGMAQQWESMSDPPPNPINQQDEE